MISTLFNTTVIVSRRTASSVNALGENVYTYSSVYTSIPARVEGYQPELQYRQSGERPKNKTIVYLDPSYVIIEQDKFYQGGTYIGLVSGINKAFGPSGVDHYEYLLENP